MAFNYPVTLVMHYTPDDLTGTLAEDLGIAFQDSTGIWHSTYNFTVDSIARTISTTVTDFFNQSITSSSKSGKAIIAGKKYFRDHSVVTRYRLDALKSSLGVLEQTPVTLMYLDNADAISANNLTNPMDEFPPLPRWVPFQNASKITWYANGIKNGSILNGALSGGNPSNYTAPGGPPPNNPVEIKAVLADKKGKYTLPINILINFKYRLKIGYVWEGSSYALNDVYTDSAEMNISVFMLDFSVDISDTINKMPSDDKPSGISPYNPDCTYQWLPDKIGMVNINGASGKVGLYSEDLKAYKFTISCTQRNINTPHWQTKCNSVTTDLGTSSNPGPPLGFTFYLNETVQDGKDGLYTAKLIPQK